MFSGAYYLLEKKKNVILLFISSIHVYVSKIPNLQFT